MNSSTLVGKHKGASFLVAGSAPSLADMDLYLPDEVVTIGSNRILNHPYFKPDYVMLCDRQPYKIDYDAGVYHEHVDIVKYLVSTTLYDPKIDCRGFAVVPKPDFPFYPWRVGTMSAGINLTDFETRFCSFATIAGPMIQAAVIMGARRIGVVGVDLQVPKLGESHFYKDAKGERVIPEKGSDTCIAKRGTMERFLDLKRMLVDRGIEIDNLSPVEDSPFASVFPSSSFDKWVRNA